MCGFSFFCFTPAANPAAIQQQNTGVSYSKDYFIFSLSLSCLFFLDTGQFMCQKWHHIFWAVFAWNSHATGGPAESKHWWGLKSISEIHAQHTTISQLFVISCYIKDQRSYLTMFAQFNLSKERIQHRNQDGPVMKDMFKFSMDV